MKPEFYYPAKPYIVNQEWGTSHPEIYSQFGFTRHNGVDIRLGTDKTLYAPFSGYVVRIGNQPKGGGIFLGLMSAREYTFPDGVTCRVLVDLLHCERLLVTEGQSVTVGDKVAIADNTGFSTGEHTHCQFRRAKNWNNLAGDNLKWEEVDKNEANNSFDPTPYWTHFYAVDYTQAKEIENKVSMLQKAVDLLKQLFKK